MRNRGIEGSDKRGRVKNSREPLRQLATCIISSCRALQRKDAATSTGLVASFQGKSGVELELAEN